MSPKRCLAFTFFLPLEIITEPADLVDNVLPVKFGLHILNVSLVLKAYLVKFRLRHMPIVDREGLAPSHTRFAGEGITFLPPVQCAELDLNQRSSFEQ